MNNLCFFNQIVEFGLRKFQVLNPNLLRICGCSWRLLYVDRIFLLLFFLFIIIPIISATKQIYLPVGSLFFSEVELFWICVCVS